MRAAAAFLNAAARLPPVGDGGPQSPYGSELFEPYGD